MKQAFYMQYTSVSLTISEIIRQKNLSTTIFMNLYVYIQQSPVGFGTCVNITEVFY